MVNPALSSFLQWLDCYGEKPVLTQRTVEGARHMRVLSTHALVFPMTTGGVPGVFPWQPVNFTSGLPSLPFLCLVFSIIAGVWSLLAFVPGEVQTALSLAMASVSSSAPDAWAVGRVLVGC